MRCVSEDTLRLFLSNLVANSSVLKIGYGVHGDLCMLAKTWHFAMDIIGSPKRVLDLQIFVQEVGGAVSACGSGRGIVCGSGWGSIWGGG